MNRLYQIGLLLLLLTLVVTRSNGAVTVTPASGLCLNVSPGGYIGIGNIVIDENNNADFAVQAGATFVLTAPAGFQFLAGTGNVNYTAGRNFSSASVVVAAGTITVTYSCSGTNRDDQLTISNIQARATVAGASGSIFRTGGTASISGDASGGGVNHGSLTASNAGVTITSAAAGNWSAGATWVGGLVPSCGAHVVIAHNVTVNVAANANNLTINTGVTLTGTNAVTVAGTFSILGTGTYIHDNNSSAATTIFAGTESFSPTSTIRIIQWYNTGVPLPTNITGNFGNIIFDEGNGWSQDGLFAPAKIKGTLTVTSGQITMDDGTGMTTALTLQDVVINNSGVLRMASGANRNLTLVTKSYSDSRTGGSSYSGVQFNCAGAVSWTANGNVTVDPDWSYYEGSGTTSGNSSITINGNLNITGGKFDFNRNVDAQLTLIVTGDINISGNPGWVRFLDRNAQSLSVTATNLNISSGSANTFHGGSSPTGNATFNITNDINITTTSGTATLVSSTPNAASLTVTVGRDLIITDGDLILANTNAATTLTVGRNLIVNNSNGDFYGQVYPNCNKLTTINVSGTLQVNSGDYYTSQGQGNIDMNITETIDINNGRFYGIFHTTATNNGSVTLDVNDIDFDGGTFHLMSSRINDGKTVQVNCHNDIMVDFLNASDIFTFIGLTGTNNPLLDLNVTNNVTIGGNFAGSYFLSSAASGNETVDIGGNLTVNAGDVSFVGTESSLIASHNIVTNITGNVTINGGITRLSTGIGTADVNIGGNVSITGGTLNLKYDSGTATMDVAGTYTQSAGTFNLHSRAANTADQITVSILGNFLMSNGTLNFDNMASGAGLAEHQLFLAGSTYTLGGSAIITHANYATTNFIFGQIYFNRSGTTVYSRSSSTNEIRHVKMTVNAGTTLDASSSTNNLQITSINSSVTATHNSFTIDGILNMGSRIIAALPIDTYYARTAVGSGGRYRLSHTGGLFSGTMVASSIAARIVNNYRNNYRLDPNSTVEYYGTSTTIITGVPNGIANGTNHKYGILEINFTGAAGTTWVYPETADEIYVRTSLVLTNGEFNLDDDHVTNTGGKPIIIENGATISRTNGFIRSETVDASALVKWTISANGTYRVPFGYDASSYIPFTFQQTSGAAGVVSFATYRTAADNTPFPPTVTHVRDVSGNDNSSNTVDRFWHLTTSAAANANLTFTYVASEGTGIVSPRAQLWEPVTTGWFAPIGGQSNPTATSTLAGGFSNFNTWWTLAAGSSPLPIELLSFDVKKSGEKVNIHWATASEINNDYFTLQKSSDGHNFETLQIVDGAGNSTSTIEYAVTDASPFAGINYYRLQQTDFDGKFTYSDIKSVYFGKTGTYSSYPNPVSKGGDLNVYVPAKGEYVVSIVEATGKVVFSSNYIVDESFHILLNSQNLPASSGIYHLLITGSDDRHSQKFFIQ